MASIVEISGNTVTTDGTEQTLDTITSGKALQLHLDTVNNANGDTIAIRYYTKVRSGGTSQLAVEYFFSHVQAIPNKVLDVIGSDIEVKITIQKIAGSNHTYIWSIKGEGIAAQDFQAGAINASAIADNAIDAGAIATGAITAAKFAAGAIDAAAIATDAIDADSLKSDAAVEIAGKVWDEALSGHTTAGSAGKKLGDLTSGSAPTAADVADAVWDELISGHAISGSTGEALSAAGASGDPWTTALPGSYSAGQAGYVVGHNIDAQISTRLATSSYTAPDNTDIASILGYVDTEIAAIKAVTDQFVFSVANVVNASVRDWQGSTPNALQSGRVDAYVGAVAAGVIAAASFAANALDAVWSTATRVLTAGTNIVLAKGVGLTGLNDIAASAILSDATPFPGADIDATISSRMSSSDATVAQINTRVAAIKAITDALPQSVWDVLTSALTATGSVGKYIMDTLDAAISSRLDGGDYTAPPSAAAVADAVWDEALSGHQTSGSTGEALQAAEDMAGNIEGHVTDILDAISGLNSVTTADILNMAYEGSENFRDFLRLARAVLYGASTGQPSAPIYKSADSGTDRVTAVVDASGNRIISSLDAS